MKHTKKTESETRPELTQQELLKLVKPWPINWTPEFRGYTCAKCGKTIVKAWHVHLLIGGYKREIHICAVCGEEYGLVVPSGERKVQALHDLYTANDEDNSH